MQQWKKQHIDKVRALTKKYYLENRESMLNKAKIYRQTEKGKQYRHNEYMRYKDKYPQKIIARRRIGYLLRKSYIQRDICALCGTTKNIEAHHENYNEPYVIIWLCTKCHNSIGDKDDFQQIQ